MGYAEGDRVGVKDGCIVEGRTLGTLLGIIDGEIEGARVNEGDDVGSADGVNALGAKLGKVRVSEANE